MNYNGGIGDDDGDVDMETMDVDMETRDVDIETVTDTLWSVDMPRDRIQNISSKRGPLLTKPLKFDLTLAPRVFMPNSIVSLHRIQKLPSGKSRKISISQDSENSAARCQFTLGQKPQLFPEKKLTKVWSPPKYTAVGNSVTCDSSEATSATTTDRSTVLARRTYTRNPAVPAIDKKGSYHHYLYRKIKLLISIITLYTQNIDREIRRINFTVDLYSQEIENEITMLKSKVDSNADDLVSKLNLIGSKMKSNDRDLDHKIMLLMSKINSYVHDLYKKITSLNSKIASYAHDFKMQIALLNSKTNLYGDDLFKKYWTMHLKFIADRLHFRAEFKKLKSETV